VLSDPEDILIQHIRSETRKRDAEVLRDLGSDDTCTCGAAHRDVRNHKPGCRKSVWDEAARTLELLSQD